jgi:dihydrolipoamide dehydrogenase
MTQYDIIIVGAGPGGYVAAIRAAQLRQKVLLVEKEKIGGTCMNWGCIPTKFLLHHTHICEQAAGAGIFKGPVDKIKCNWEKIQDDKEKAVSRLIKGIEFVLKKNKVDIIRGTAHFKNQNTVVIEGGNGEGQQRFQAEAIVLATGSRPFELPFLKPDGRTVITSRTALELKTIPGRMLVVGAGAIGLEMGTLFRRLGSKVTVLELMDQVLPGSDKEMAKKMMHFLKKQGLDIRTQMNITSSDNNGNGVKVTGTDMKKDVPFEFKGDVILLAAGRRPNSEKIMQEIPGIKTDKNGFVQVDSRLQTDIPGIYAIGDLIGGHLLAHKASHEGMAAAENAAGGNESIDCGALPAAVFTEPEFAAVGPTEEEAKKEHGTIQVGSFPLQASGRALTMGSMEGSVKLIADKDGKVIAGHILSPAASELIAEVTLAVNQGLHINEVAGAIHIHPTLSETVMEAALSADKRAIHILNRQ